jgi:hypothetical protein
MLVRRLYNRCGNKCLLQSVERWKALFCEDEWASLARRCVRGRAIWEKFWINLDKTLHVPENYEFPSHWWVPVVVQSPQSSPYPPRPLSLIFYAQGQFLLRPWSDTSPSLGQGQPFDTLSTLYPGLPRNPQMFCHKWRNHPWTPPWPSLSGQRISPSCTFEMILENYTVQMTFAYMWKCHMDMWRWSWSSRPVGSGFDDNQSNHLGNRRSG